MRSEETSDSRSPLFVFLVRVLRSPITSERRREGWFSEGCDSVWRFDEAWCGLVQRRMDELGFGDLERV